MDALRLGGVVELHRAEQIAVIGHGDRGHLLLGDDSISWSISQASGECGKQYSKGVSAIVQNATSRKAVGGEGETDNYIVTVRAAWDGEICS